MSKIVWSLWKSGRLGKSGRLVKSGRLGKNRHYLEGFFVHSCYIKIEFNHSFAFIINMYENLSLFHGKTDLLTWDRYGVMLNEILYIWFMLYYCMIVSSVGWVESLNKSCIWNLAILYCFPKTTHIQYSLKYILDTEVNLKIFKCSQLDKTNT